MILRFFVLTLVGCALPMLTFAQTAQLSGLITDPTGRAVSEADVQIRNEGTGLMRTTKSTDEGGYTIPALAPGSYTLRAQKTGFKTGERTGVILQTDSNLRFDLALSLGEVAESVTVQDAPPLIQETPEIGTSITRREYESLPMIQIGRIRSPAAFVLLAPGVQGSVRLDGSQYASASNQVQVHGQPNFTIEYLMDGLPAGPGYGNYNESAPAVDAIREFRLITSQMPPEYGASGAAITSFSIMSGSNQLHGALYDYLRNNNLDARSFLSAVKPPLKLNEFGAAVGGPVCIPKLYDGKDRTFFFFSYGASRKRGADSITTAQIPTPQAIAGNFSGLRNNTGQLRTIYDPTTTRTDANGNLVRTPFSGNIIPVSLLDPAAVKIASYYPAPNSNLGYTGATGDILLDPDTYTGKLDHKISDRNHLSGAIVRTDIPRVFAGGPLPLPLRASSFNQQVTSWTLRLNNDFVLSPTLLNTFAGGFNRFNTPLGPPTSTQPWSSILGIPEIGDWAFPNITFGNGYQTIGSTNFFNYVNQTALLKDSVSWQHGAHSFKFGGEWRYNEHNSIVNGNSMGVFNFTNAYTANPSTLNSTGDSFASFLLGGYNSVSSSGPLVYSARWSYGGLYAQDQWRLSPRLTLTYGLRWEWQTPPYENQNLSGQVDLNTPNPGAGNLPGAVIFAGRNNSRTFGSTDLSGFGPRAGFAWKATNHTAIRGGYGIYYSKWTSGSNVFGIDSPGFQASYSNASQNSGLTPPGILRAGLPALATTPTLTSTVLNGQAATFADSSSWKLPRTQNWSFSVQQQLTSDMLLEASYIGIHSTRQNAYLMSNINQVDPKYLPLGSLLNQSVASPAAVAAGIPLPYSGFTGTVAQALRPYPQYQRLTSFLAKPGKSVYHALELHLRQRFHSGLSFDLNYTWSKNLGYADTVNIAVGGVNNLLQNAYNQTAERSLLPNDVPHALVAAWVYDLPFGAGHRLAGNNRFASAILGGWSLSATQRYQSGTPLQIYSDNSLPLFNNVQRPNIVPGQDPQTNIGIGNFNPAVDRRINLGAFSAAQPFTFGNSAPTLGNLRNFPVFQEDLAITKRVSLSERWKLEIYGQSFNVANRHRFTSLITNSSSPSFGRAGGSSVGRYIQLGVKIRF